MKKLLILLIVTCSAVFIFAEEDYNWGTQFTSPSLLFTLEGGSDLSTISQSLSLRGYAQMEYIYQELDFDGVFPIDLGIAVNGAIGADYNPTDLSLGFGALATVHWGFRGLGLPFSEYLDNLDIGFGLGLKYDLSGYNSGFGLQGWTALQYALNDNMFITVSERFWGSRTDTVVGLTLLLGQREGLTVTAYTAPVVEESMRSVESDWYSDTEFELSYLGFQALWASSAGYLYAVS
jgi:hypothetical protein